MIRGSNNFLTYIFFTIIIVTFALDFFYYKGNKLSDSETLDVTRPFNFVLNWTYDKIILIENTSSKMIHVCGV